MLATSNTQKKADHQTAQRVDPKLPYTSKYWNVIAPVLRHLIGRRWGYGLGARAYKGGRPIYRELIDAAPAIGAGNPMAKNIYEACVFFAMWKAADGDITPDMMRQVVRDLFDLPVMRVAGLTGDLRTQKGIDKLGARMRACASWAQARPEIQGATWDFNFDDDRGGTVVSFHYTRCPINDLCREQGLMEILPVMCEIDHITPRLMHGRLTREHTLAQGGPCCDYLIEGE